MRSFFMAGALGAGVLAAAPASAFAVIDNGTIQLGVDRLGQLNVFTNGYPSTSATIPIGLRDLRTGHESTSQGCLCEGWGVAIQGTTVTGFANNSLGIGGLTSVDITILGAGTHFASNGQAVSVTTDTGPLRVNHLYTPSSEANLYEVKVSITNMGDTATTGSLLYRRTMDWDIDPTPFREFSTIQGTAGALNVLGATNNGFCNSNPLTGCGPLLPGGSGDFLRLGPSDHGANFDFIFDPLGAGETRSFSTFYGAAPTTRDALVSLSAVGAEIYSLGQSIDDPDRAGSGFSTFIFGFAGVGGTVVPPPPGGVIPEPATWAMMIAGFGLVGAAARRRRTMLQPVVD